MAVLHQLAEASMAGYKTGMMFDRADMDMSGNLTRTEMTSIFANADTDSELAFIAM